MNGIINLDIWQVMLAVGIGQAPRFARLQRSVVLSIRERDYVLSLVYEGERDASHLAIIDAARPEAGAIAKLWFDHAIPLGFHGAWSS